MTTKTKTTSTSKPARPPYMTVRCDCGWSKDYRSEAAYLRDVPDSIPYCHKCGKPILVDFVD